MKREIPFWRIDRVNPVFFRSSYLSVGKMKHFLNSLRSPRNALVKAKFHVAFYRIGRAAEERDLASGLRLCGLLVANGLILGRAVAGNWHSEAATIHDLIHDGWAASLLSAAALRS
jgi:hypothetical protein